MSTFFAFFFIFANPAQAATRTWDNGGGDGLWSTCTNWSSDLCPGSSDVATFNNTSVANSTIDSSFAGSVQGISIASTYSGTIVQQRTSVSIGTGGYSQSGGTFSQGTTIFDIDDAGFTLSGGTFNTGVGTTSVERNFNISGGTYNASSTDGLNFNGGSSDAGTLTCTGTFPGLIDITKTSALTASFSVAAGCTANTVNTISTVTILSVSGTLNFGQNVTVARLTVNNGGTASLGSNISFPYDQDATNADGSLILNSGSTFTTTDTAFTLHGDLTKSSSATADFTGKTLTFAGTNSNGDSTFTCTGEFEGTVNITKSQSGSDFTLASGCEVNFSDSVSAVSVVTINGTANFGSTLSLGRLVVSNGGTAITGANVTFPYDGDATNSDGSLILNSGSTFTTTDTAITLEGDFTKSATANADFTGITLSFGGSSNNNQDSTFTCSGEFEGTVNITKSQSGADFTLASGCEINTSASVSTTALVTINGTANFGNTVSIARLTVNSGGVANTGSSVTFPYDNSATNGDGSLILNSGSTFTTTDTAITLQGNFTRSSSAAADFTGVTLTFSAGGNNTSDTTFTCTGDFEGLVIISKSTSGTDFTLAAGCNINLGGTSSGVSLVTINGTLDLNGFNLSVSSTFSVSSTGRLRLQGGEVVKNPTLSAGSTVEYDGSGTYTALRGGNTYSNIVFSGSGTWATSSAVTVARNFEQTAGTLNHTNTLTFTGTTAYTATTSSGTNLANVTINGSGGTITLAGSGFSLSGNLTLTAGTLDASTNKCSNASCPITLGGNWVGGSNLFTPRTGTVTLNGTNQSITGTNAFYNLAKSVVSAATLTFGANETQTISNTWSANGASGNRLSLRSNSDGTQWNIDPQGTRTPSFLDVKDSNNVNATVISAGGTNSINSLNNTNWLFTAAPDTPSSLGPAGYVDGSWGTDTTPTLTFTTSDDDGDPVAFQIIVDDSSDFGSPVISYTSAYAAAGSSSFTVGQAVGSGSYATGSQGQTLSDGTYYWEVLAGDGSATSSYAVANSGSVAFGIDTAAPTAGSVALSATSTDSFTITISGASDGGSGLAATPYFFYESSTGTSSLQSGTSWISAPLTPNTQYTFSAGVSDAAGNTATTSSVSGYTFAQAPTSAVATPDSSSQITLSWSTGSNPVGTEYYAENTTAGTNSGWTTSTSWVSNSLTASTPYDFTVKARNTDGGETTTASANATTSDAASTPDPDDDDDDSGGGGGGGGSSGGGGTVNLYTTNAAQSLLVGPAQINKGKIVYLSVLAKTFTGGARTSGGDTVKLTVRGANTAQPVVVDNDDGSYTAQYLAANAGVDTVTATINGQAVEKDTDGVSNGSLLVTVVDPNVVVATRPGNSAQTPAATNSQKPPTTPGGNSNKPPVVPQPPVQNPWEVPKEPPGQEKKVEVPAFQYGLTTQCWRAFSWSGQGEGAVKVYRTIGNGHESQVATINPKTGWYIDIDPIGGAELTYRLAFKNGDRSVTFSAEGIAACRGEVPEHPVIVAEETATSTTATSTEDTDTPIVLEPDVPTVVTNPDSSDTQPGVIEIDLDNDGNKEQFIGGVYQDTDGSSAPLATIEGGVVVDTDSDGRPDVYWLPGTGTSPTVLAGDRLFLVNGNLTGVQSYELAEATNYTVSLVGLLGGEVALAVNTSEYETKGEGGFFSLFWLLVFAGVLALIAVLTYAIRYVTRRG